jgi:hypothetical protein
LVFPSIAVIDHGNAAGPVGSPAPPRGSPLSEQIQIDGIGDGL